MHRLNRGILCALVIAGLIAPFQAGASSQVRVTLRVSNPVYYAAIKTCPVQVQSGANGIAVLDAARASGCLSSYSTVSYSLGTFVSCIDNVCGDPAPTYLRYWAMRTNTSNIVAGRRLCEPTSYGVEGYSAAEGGELSFTFETLATGFAPTIC